MKGDITDNESTTYSTLQSLDGDDKTTDWFQFTLTASKRVKSGLRQLDADVTMILEDEDGNEIKPRLSPTSTSSASPRR